MKSLHSSLTVTVDVCRSHKTLILSSTTTDFFFCCDGYEIVSHWGMVFHTFSTSFSTTDSVSRLFLLLFLFLSANYLRVMFVHLHTGQ